MSGVLCCCCAALKETELECLPLPLSLCCGGAPCFRHAVPTSELPVPLHTQAQSRGGGGGWVDKKSNGGGAWDRLTQGMAVCVSLGPAG